MWNLSSLAQKAKNAAALIEEQINDSIGLNEGVARADDERSGGTDDENVADDEHVARGSDGWEKCDDISSDDNGQGDSKTELPGSKESKSETSYVDLKSAVESIEESDAGGAGASGSLRDAHERIESLEKQVNSLKDELAAAREASENYMATNLLLEQQVKELQEENAHIQEENKCLKENRSTGK